MAKKERYEELANTVPGLIGGVENITFFDTLCNKIAFYCKKIKVCKI